MEKSPTHILSVESPFWEMAGIGAWEFHIDTERLFWSREVYRIFGVSEDQEISREYALSFYTLRDQKRVSDALELAIRKGASYHLICEIRTAGREMRWVLTRGKVESREGKPFRIYGIIQDITQEEVTKSRARVSEERFEGLVATKNGWIWEVDKSYRITYTSVQVLDVMGYSPEEALGRSPFDFMPPEEARKIKKEADFLFTHHLPLVDLESWNIRKDGKKILLNTNAVPILSDSEELLGYRGIVEDITVRHYQQERTRQKELLLRDIKVARWEYDAIRDSLIWNPGMYEILELDPDLEPNFDLFLGLIHPDDRSEVEKLYRDAFLTKTGLSTIHRLLYPDNRIKWIRSQVRTYVNREGNSIRSLGLLQDISEVQDLQDELMEQKTYLESILSSLHTSAIVSITDTRGRIIRANERFCEVSGYREEELLGKSHRLVNSGYHPKEFWQEMWETVTQGKPWRAEVMNRGKDGSLYWVDTAINPIFDKKGKIIQFLSIRNLITDRKLAEKQLQDQNEELRVTEEELRSTIEQLTISQERLHESQERLKGLLDSQTCFVLRTDLEGNYTYTNKKFMEVFGYLYNYRNVIGKSCMNSIYEEDHDVTRNAIHQLFLDPTKTIQVEIRKPLQDGSLASTLWDFTLIRDHAGNPVEIQCVGIDFTNRRRAEEITITSKKMLEAVNQELQQERRELTAALDLINHEIDFATNLQEFLLPKRIDCSAIGLQVNTWFQPLDRVSGDLYDFFPLGEGRFRFFIADATGHGLKAGFQTMFIQTEYQRIKDEIVNPGEVLESLNHSIHKTFPDQPVYYTCLLIDIDTNRGEITYSNAAHPEPILLEGEGVRILPVTAPIMGLLKNQKFPVKTERISRPSRLVLYSDGITESHDEDLNLYGEENLIRFFRAGKDRSQEELIPELIRELENFRGLHPVFDDMTLVLVDLKEIDP